MKRDCNGHGLLAAFRAAVANLEAHADEINALNVFPVPDGDTGSNMVATVRAALQEAERSGEQTPAGIAGAISFGALMGAQGNSGVITSQVFRGMAEGLSGKHRVNGFDLARALRLGTATAYRAVAKPVEGTILTVMRESSEAAVVAAERASDMESVLTATVIAAEKSVERTPSLLPILREAGVVDAGGQGLYRLFQGALSHLLSTSAAPRARGAPAAARPAALLAQAEEGFGYETMFLVQPSAGTTLDVDAIRTALEAIGVSVVVAGDQRAVKVHVHSERPDEVIAYGLALGSLSRISVENLDAQARDVRERRASEFTGAGPWEAPAGWAPAAVEVPAPGLAVIAVTAGDGLAAVFESLGCAVVVQGGQGTNPSIGQLLKAVQGTRAGHVLLLPNNPNVVLAARQVAELSARPVSVVPTRNAAEGLAAMLALDPAASPEDNADEMARAGRSIQSLQVTKAVRDANVSGQKVRKGHTIVLDPDEGLVAADGHPHRAILAGIDALAPGYELITIYYGEGTDLAAAEALGSQIGDQRPGVEVEIVRGGQPHYRYLIAAE